MAITANYAYLSPEIAEYFEEGFERAGVDPLAIGQNHIDSALRSVRSIFNEWNTFGMRQWKIERFSQPMVTGDVDFDMPVGCTDVIHAVIRRADRDTPMYSMSRFEYLELADKDIRGRPTRFFADKRFDKVTMLIWQAPENSTDIMVIDYIRQLSQPGEMANNLQLPPTAYECFQSGLAMHLAMKFGTRERYEALKMDYGGQGYPERLGGKIFQMRAASADNADVEFTSLRRRR